MTTIQIRNVPEELSAQLKAKAASAGRSLSDYLLIEMERIASRPTREQVLQRIEDHGRFPLTPAADELAQARDERA